MFHEETEDGFEHNVVAPSKGSPQTISMDKFSNQGKRGHRWGILAMKVNTWATKERKADLF